MASKKKFYVTTPIYYVNDVPSIGHAYTTIVADILARWHKLLGEEVFFLTGSDEHGIKIQKRAAELKEEPKKFCDEIVLEFKKAWKALDIQYNNFIRTTDEKHVKAIQHAVQKLYDAGYIYKGRYKAYYCTGCEQYKTSSELVDGKCPLHNKEAELKDEEAYLFGLSSFQDELLDAVENDKFQILPRERKNEVVSFLKKERLQDVSISRKKEDVWWGIEIPFDKNYTLYVWIDAFLNYLTGIGWPDAKYKKFWPADLHLIGKDILRVHATIWPALLLALKISLPEKLFAHGYFTINGQKMSKSLGNAINPVYLAEKYGVDSLRYFLVREIPFGSDSDFSEDALKERYNSELADNLGNLVSRIAGLIEKKLNGSIGKTKIDSSLTKKLKFDEIKKKMQNFEIDKALVLIFDFINSCNLYIQEKKPWQLEGKELSEVLYTAADSLRIISILLYPFIPATAEKIASLFGIDLSKTLLKDCRFGLLKGCKIKKIGILFQKCEE